MPPAPRSAEREEERRINTRTLTIASVASASAAAVTSQLWIHGTWIAAAVTPVLVTLLSEALHRPTEKIARAWTSDQPALGRRAASPREPVAAPHGDPLQPRDPEPTPPERGGPVRVYRQPTSSTPRRRRIARGTVAATAAIAFVIGVVTLTAGDLVSGGSIGKGGSRTTLLGGGHGKKQQEQNQNTTPEQTTPDQTGTTTDQAPTTDTTPDQAPPSNTAPITPPDPTQTAPDPNAVP
jgi:hypothetical protein